MLQTWVFVCDNLRQLCPRRFVVFCFVMLQTWLFISDNLRALYGKYDSILASNYKTQPVISQYWPYKQWWHNYWRIYASLGLNGSLPPSTMETGKPAQIEYKCSHGVVRLCFVLVILQVYSLFIWVIYPNSSGFIHWHWNNANDIILKSLGATKEHST